MGERTARGRRDQGEEGGRVRLRKEISSTPHIRADRLMVATVAPAHGEGRTVHGPQRDESQQDHVLPAWRKPNRGDGGGVKPTAKQRLRYHHRGSAAGDVSGDAFNWPSGCERPRPLLKG